MNDVITKLENHINSTVPTQEGGPDLTTTGELPMIDMSEVNTQALTSSITAILHNDGMTPTEALVAGMGITRYLGELTQHNFFDWAYTVQDAMENCVLKVKGVQQDIPSMEGWEVSAMSAGLFTKEGQPGERLISLLLTNEKSMPTAAFHGITDRRRDIMPHNSTNKLAQTVSPLMQDAVDVLQATKYNVDTFMFNVARRTGNRAEAYVIEGCAKLIKHGNVPVVAEFFADRRGRLYQGDCHGPNGQSSDMARSLMDLHGVHTNYDPVKADTAVRAEMADMVKGEVLNFAIQDFSDRVKGSKDAADWIMEQTKLKDNDLTNEMVSKPYSFCKAMRILSELEKGNKPYIGMAFGLDAKCSGPQYGAIMTGDRKIAAATGFVVQAVPQYNLT